LGVVNGGILHPLDVNDVVHVPVPIDHVGGHSDVMPVDWVHFCLALFSALKKSHPID
jgi:hypothetical protein